MGTISYNTDRINCTYIYRATSGGTVFSANLAGSGNFDYFTDTAQVNDAIYFADSTIVRSNLYLNIGTPMVASCTLAWEYWCIGVGWRAIHGLTDGSNNLTTAGAVTVNFPLQANGSFITVNGSNLGWIRCRIASLTSITEGGANTTTRASSSSGYVYVADYTASSPCTWTEIYNWVVANAPEIGAYKWGTNCFKFDNCKFNFASTVRSTNEFIFTGNGCYYQQHALSYYHSGNKIGTNGWSNPSYLFLSTRGPTMMIGSNNLTKIYGGAVTAQQFVNTVDGLTCYNGGYTSLQSGEGVGIYLAQSGYLGSSTLNRCIVDGGFIVASPISVYPTDLQIANPADVIFTNYSIDMDFNGLKYALPATSFMGTAGNYGTYGWSNIMNFRNPSPALPSQSGTPPLLFNRILGSQTNVLKYFYYDTSAGTYTDYTAQAIGSAIDDVPLDGDVGDIYYIQCSATVGGMSYQPAIQFVITNQVNDYQYAIEYWNGTTWYTMPSDYIYDNTSNLSTSGNIYLNTTRTMSTAANVNGVTGAWIRFRITSKGTGTPRATRVYQRAQAGIGNWRINEIYTTSWKVQDENGNPIQGATITISDSENTSNTYTTGALGTIADIDLRVKYSYFDKNVSEALYNTATKDLSSFKIKVSMDGYETYNENLTVSTKLDKTIALKKAIPIMFDTEGKGYLKLNQANEGAFRDVIVEGEIPL